MVEMVETANNLHHATPKSLLILDEIGRGTSTYDGLSLAWSIVEYIHNQPHLGSKTLFASHYHELLELDSLLPGVSNYNVAVAEDGESVIFTHHITPGGSDRSYGLHVAKLAGLPQAVIRRAQELLESLESTDESSRVFDSDDDGKLTLSTHPNPLLDELRDLDVDTLSPLQALEHLYDWQRRFTDETSPIPQESSE